MTAPDLAVLDDASDRAGTALRGAWLDLPRAGWFEPARLVASLMGQARIDPARVARIEAVGGGWALFDPQDRLLAEAAAVILATGAQAWPEGAPSLPLEIVAGRAAVFDCPPPAVPLAWGRYAAPAPGGGLLVGATHERGGFTSSQDEAAETLRRGLAERLPDLAARTGTPRAVWSAVRAALPDRLPAAGGAARPDLARVPGLFALAGFGARGFAHAPLLAEQLASELCGEPSALPADGRRTLHPARFAERRLRKDRR